MASRKEGATALSLLKLKELERLDHVATKGSRTARLDLALLGCLVLLLWQ